MFDRLMSFMSLDDPIYDAIISAVAIWDPHTIEYDPRDPSRIPKNPEFDQKSLKNTHFGSKFDEF